MKTLARRVAERSAEHPRIVERVLEAFVAEVLEVTRAGRRVQVRGLGTFRPRVRRVARMRLRAGVVEIPQRTVLTFRATDAVRVLEVLSDA